MSSGMKSLPHSESMRDWERIEPICISFESAWQRGETPAMETYLQGDPELARPLLLEELLRIDLYYRQTSGQQVDADHYKTLFPEAHEIIDQVFASQPQFPSRRDFVPQALISRYRIIEEIGRGSFGVVYLAQDQDLGRHVAIKLAGDGQRATAQQATRLFEEVRAAAGLRHPGIVAVHDVQPLSDGGIFAVLEYVAGGALNEYAKANLHSDFRKTAVLFASISDAVAYAHRRRFVHRDLHPGNILVDDNGAPHVADFGLAVHEDEQRGRAGERAGSLLFMSPEQVRGDTHRLDGRADIWAIGAMLYEVLTGRTPFQGDSSEQIIDEILNREPKPPRQIRAEIPADLEQICLRCLAKNPEERFNTAGDLANALRATLQRKTYRMRRILLGGMAAAFLAAVLFLAWQSAYRIRTPRMAFDPVALDLVVWKSGRWHSIERPGVLPLREGDQLRIHAFSSQARYLYVVWIDANGEASAVYPWVLGDWRARDAHERMQTEIGLPAGGPDEVWPMRVQRSGYEMLLLLARSTPLPENVDLAAALDNLPLLEMADPKSMGARFDYIRIEPLSETRDFDVAKAERVADPLLGLQREMKNRLETLFPEIECLVLSVAKDDES